MTKKEVKQLEVVLQPQDAHKALRKGSYQAGSVRTTAMAMDSRKTYILACRTRKERRERAVRP